MQKQIHVISSRIYAYAVYDAHVRPHTLAVFAVSSRRG